MRILIYFDDSELSLTALRTGASLATRLGLAFTIVTSRPGTVPVEQQPRYGENLARAAWENLPPGLKLLSSALEETVSDLEAELAKLDQEIELLSS